MQNQETVQRCLKLVEELSQSQGWPLTAEQRSHYAQRAAALTRGREAGDSALATTLSYYHTEHALVEALTDSESPDHAAAWQLLERQVRSLIAGKLARGAQRDGAIGLEDLAQEAIADLWRGLQQFRYQSRLQTWVFTVAGHCLNRALRAQRTQKRASTAEAQSLELITEALGDTLPDPQMQAPDQIVDGRELGQLLRQILAHHPDRRLATIMHLWAVEERSLREIGVHLHLSVGRVHGLLAQAQAMLQANPSLLAWVERSPIDAAALGESAAPPGVSSAQD